MCKSKYQQESKTNKSTKEKNRTRITEDYIGAGLLVESSINLIASRFLLGSKTNSISATAALCIKEPAGNEVS